MLQFQARSDDYYVSRVFKFVRELMMQCQKCKKNEATVHLTEIHEGQRTEMHLCQLCAEEQGIAIKTNMPISELLSGLLASEPSEEEMQDPFSGVASCSNCGFTMEQLRKESVLGCPDDYDALEDDLLPLIKKAHGGNSVHSGKVPKHAEDHKKNEVEIMALKKELDHAVLIEDYESAAKLRDRIKELEQGS